MALDPAEIGPLYHGTCVALQPGDLLVAGRPSNYRPEVVMNHVYVTALPNGAGLAAELAVELTGAGEPHVYLVEATGPIEDDPNVTDKKFPGNPTRSYRSASPFTVIREIDDWTRLTPEELEMWRERLRGIAANPDAEIIN